MALSAGFAAGPSYAQDINEVTPLTFGEIALTSYNNVARVTVFGSGTYSTNAYVYLHSPPARGEYQVTGAPPTTAYTVSLPASVDLIGPGGHYFRLDNFQVSPALHVTDASGEDTFYIGARMQSQGGGIVYGDGDYDGIVTITLAF